jgi:hypothetical protein
MTVLTVEVADGDLVNAVGRDEVWNATDQLASSGSQLTIGVKNWDAKNSWRFWQAKRAMLNRQLWGWTGRTYRHPVVDYASNILMVLDKQAVKIRQGQGHIRRAAVRSVRQGRPGMRRAAERPVRPRRR